MEICGWLRAVAGSFSTEFRNAAARLNGAADEIELLRAALTCDLCNGTGKISRDRSWGVVETEPCPDCSGTREAAVELKAMDERLRQAQGWRPVDG